uniref:Uncharacterized protein n=1 Tax=viral metagenome TaxID=1070528 RepID=A0A6C0F2Q7_9ZZZZ
MDLLFILFVALKISKRINKIDLDVSAYIIYKQP